MRQESFAGGSIKYPDRVVFVNNPNYIVLGRLIAVGDNCSITFRNPRIGKIITINAPYNVIRKEYSNIASINSWINVQASVENNTVRIVL